ncbi:MAG: aminopeptidase P N-terminal domain-containing protein [Gemmatimonadota bacterium]
MIVRSRVSLLAALLVLAAGATASPGRAQVPHDGVEHPEMFAERRAELLRRLPPGAVAVFHAKPVYERNNDVNHPYRQASNFYYLTGFEEPEAVAVLSNAGEGPAYTLFVRPRNADPFDAEGEIWAGKRWGTEGARQVFKAEAAYVIDSLPAVLPRLVRGASDVLYSSAGAPDFGERLRGWAGPGAGGGPAANAGFESPDAIVHEMRLILSPAEVVRVQRAIDITAEAQRASMRAARPGMYEYELEALQYYLYRVNGSRRWGFPSIVGSGPNSVTLHYEENDRRMEDGDVVVLDIGAEYAMYTADVTRTIPVNGRFTPEQREVYQVIVDAQDAAMELMRPGNTIAQSSARAAEVVTRGLVRLGLLQGSVEENLRSGAYRRFYMHGLSHWIGLDVHDPAPYSEPDGSPRVFRSGMVLSNEPGIYVRAGTPGVDPKWFAIGVRLENDVLITEGDPVDLTAAVPRTIAEVEAEMAKPALTIDTGAARPPLTPPRVPAGVAPSPEVSNRTLGGQDRDVTPPPRVTPPSQGKPKGEPRP